MSTEPTTIPSPAAPSFKRGQRVAVVNVTTGRAWRIATVEAVNKASLRVSAPANGFGGGQWTVDGKEGRQRHGAGPTLPVSNPSNYLRAVEPGDDLDVEAYDHATALAGLAWAKWRALPLATLRAIAAAVDATAVVVPS